MEEKIELALGMYREAGKILREVKEATVSKVKEGVSLLEVAEFVENSIREKGGEPAFPCNISRNEEAAHSTPTINDPAVFGDDDLVKIDIGLHLDGYIADSAVTIDLSGENGELVSASEAALRAAIEIIRDGISTVEIGGAIESAIRERGYKPIVNLSGHGLTRYNQHASPTIPNLRYEHGVILKENDLLAIEPFATTGTGRVVEEGGNVEIYSLKKAKPVRLSAAKKLLKEIEKYQGLPFARRWLPSEQLDLALRTLKKTGALRLYPVLRDEGRGLISQAEDTVIVKKDTCEVTT